MDIAHPTTKVAQSSNSSPDVSVISVSASAFKDAVETFKDRNPIKGAFVSSDLEYETMRCYVAIDGNAGFAVASDGEICSLFNGTAPEGTGEELLEIAIDKGGNKLNCFDGKLVEIYQSNGFKEVGRIEWDDQYAPENWSYEKFGRPDIVQMRLE